MSTLSLVLKLLSEAYLGLGSAKTLLIKKKKRKKNYGCMTETVK